MAERGGQTVIVGLGKTGLSCVRHLVARGESVSVVDSRQAPPMLETLQREYPGVPVHLGGFDARILRQAGRLVMSPGVPLAEPAIRAAQARGVPVLGDIDLFARQARAPVVAVTGSNGKSTVTTLVAEMAAAQRRDVRVGGNLGTPALDLLAGPEPDLYVLELSSFQLETSRCLEPAAAVVLNVSPDHMDRYPDLAAYTRAKQRVFLGHGTMVLNRDDPRVMAMAEPGRPTLGFTLSEPVEGDFGLRELNGDTGLAFGGRILMFAQELKIHGRHNLANALAALALGHSLGLDLPRMLAVLRGFGGLPHRCQWVGDQGGVDWYNDSKGTNVAASVAAIEGLQPRGRLVLIAGGVGKGADFGPLGNAACARARAVVLLGRDGPLIGAALKGCVPVEGAESMDQAVRAAARLARPGDTVLLSPACASFDMFTDYHARGDAFVAAVRRLEGRQ